jgi:GT2 family glycosyltransferase/glycosyltransferase involved in cell wall biosynthesis
MVTVIERRREPILTAVADSSDVAVAVIDERAPGTTVHELLEGIDHTQLHLDHLAAACGDTLLLFGGPPGDPLTARAWGVAELRFRRVLMAPAAAQTPGATGAGAAPLAPGTSQTLTRLTEFARDSLPLARTGGVPLVTAVVLTQGRPAFLRRALDSLAIVSTQLHTLVIDTGAPPNDALDIANLCAGRPDTDLHRSESKLGCAAGRNLGVRLAETELVLFLDDDAELLPGALEHLLAQYDGHPGTEAAAATVVRPDGTIIVSGGALEVTDAMVSFELLGDGRPYAIEALPASGPSGWAPLGATLVRREALERQPLDEQMQAYFEDNEWCYRVSCESTAAFRRSREAIVLHHLLPKHGAGTSFTARASIAPLLASYAHFYERHEKLLGPWLFDHVPELRAPDGSCDLAGARLLMELTSAKGIDWVLMEWMNGDLGGMLNAGATRLELKAAKASLAQSRAETERAREETERVRVELQRRVQGLEARAAQDAHTISSLDATLNTTNRRLHRVERSVTWQLFQRIRARVFSVLGGEDSVAVQRLQRWLRHLGRRLDAGGAGTARPAPAGTPASLNRVATPRVTGPIELPVFEDPAVSIVIPLYAHAELTRSALESIRSHTQHISYEVILVDDSEDSDTKALLKLVRGARIVVNDRNLGYLRSMRRGLEEARGRWVVLANNDIEVQPGWLTALLECGESAPDIAIVAPKYIYPDGSLAEAGGVIWRDGTGANYGRGDNPESCRYEYRREIDYGSAAALLVRADFWHEVGGFDERFLPMYYEDTDLCFEARARGLRVMYEPRARVVHVEGASAGTDETEGHKRHQQENRPKFVEKWRERLETEHLPPGQADHWLGATLRSTRHVLVVDHRMPMWDRESGGLRMRGILQTLLELGCHVSFLPDNLLPMQPYTRELQRIGVEVLCGIEIPADLIKIMPGLSLVILSRPQVAPRWLDLVREHAPQAPVVYDTVDLHWLREARRAALAGGPNARELVMTQKAKAMRELELGLIRATDATLVVTEDERARVLADVPTAVVQVLPNVNVVREGVPPAPGRAGMLFVGGFEHPPNVDAALALVHEVMPLVWARNDDVSVTIVGSDPPPEVAALASPRVRVAGWVADLEPLMDHARALLAPLTYGAGLKGKVTQALAAGLPVVTTPVGAEGLDATDGIQMLIGRNPAELADRVERVVRDDALWHSLSRAGQQLAAETCSPAVMEQRLSELLERTRMVALPAQVA